MKNRNPLYNDLFYYRSKLKLGVSLPMPQEPINGLCSVFFGWSDTPKKVFDKWLENDIKEYTIIQLKESIYRLEQYLFNKSWYEFTTINEIKFDIKEKKKELENIQKTL